MSLRHKGWQIRVTVEQIVERTDTDDRPGNAPTEKVVHHEEVFPIEKNFHILNEGIVSAIGRLGDFTKRQ